jgi:hypothetical protein
MARTAAPTKADYEQMLSEVYDIADDALSPKTTRSQAIDALMKINDLLSPDDDDDESDDDTNDDEDDE